MLIKSYISENVPVMIKNGDILSIMKDKLTDCTGARRDPATCDAVGLRALALIPETAAGPSGQVL